MLRLSMLREIECRIVNEDTSYQIAAFGFFTLQVTVKLIILLQEITIPGHKHQSFYSILFCLICKPCDNQRYLNELTEQNMKGYYFNADLSPENSNSQKAVMKACFQSAEDSRGQESQIHEKMIFIESFLTAPYGTYQ